MIFITNDTLTDEIEINTLAELRAYALGGTGKIEIDFCHIHPMTGETLSKPTISEVKNELAR